MNPRFRTSVNCIYLHIHSYSTVTTLLSPPTPSVWVSGVGWRGGAGGGGIKLNEPEDLIFKKTNNYFVMAQLICISRLIQSLHAGRYIPPPQIISFFWFPRIVLFYNLLTKNTIGKWHEFVRGLTGLSYKSLDYCSSKSALSALFTLHH